MHRLPSGLSFFLLLCVGMLLIGSGRSAAQETMVEKAHATPYTINVTARLVTLDVILTDHKSRLRNDLRSEDFQITKDGAWQTIASFEPLSMHTLPMSRPVESTADLERRGPQPPVNIIALDELQHAVPGDDEPQ